MQQERTKKRSKRAVYIAVIAVCVISGATALWTSKGAFLPGGELALIDPARKILFFVSLAVYVPTLAAIGRFLNKRMDPFPTVLALAILAVFLLFFVFSLILGAGSSFAEVMLEEDTRHVTDPETGAEYYVVCSRWDISSPYYLTYYKACGPLFYNTKPLIEERSTGLTPVDINPNYIPRDLRGEGNDQ